MLQPSELKAGLEGHLLSISHQTGWMHPLYAPITYILTLGGKRIRPMLLMLSYQAISGRPGTEALNCAAAVEFFHNFSLIHDDIMDKAPVRRGQSSVHEKWNMNTAILSGDAMFALAYEFLIKDFPAQAAPLLRQFTRVAVGVCEGQMEDMEMAGKPATIPQYIEMIRKKTAMLIGGSLALGAIAANAPEIEVQALYRLGETAGIGFQLHDDFLDVYAPADKFGKQVGGDIVENKMTFLLIRCQEKASPAQRQNLERLLNQEHNNEAKVAGVIALYDELGIRQETIAEMDRYFQKADEMAKAFRKHAGFEWIDGYLESIAKRDH
jgi:geranylgeranyl diphosphate synthase, type II